MTAILTLGVAVRLAAFIIPARRHRRWRFAETNARPTAGNPRRGWRRVKSAELRAFVRDTPAIKAASVTVATVAVMRNLSILLSASAQIAPLGVVIS
jgi:hypothetical protein